MVSIIIRTKNEQKWIASCLESVFRQRYRDFEVIVVDNCSTDQTLERIKNFNVQVITIKDFLPGKAINLGIRASSGDILVCLSGHCIPVNEFWLENLIKDFDDPQVAGVYGRQEPMSFSSDLDKRDLLNTFGLDRKIQKKDIFFHNANSAVRRCVWEKFPFDETVTNIEDRVWAKRVLGQHYEIIYEPEASVFHYHGINQDRNVERAKKVVKILEQIHPASDQNPLNGLNVTTIIPVCGEMKYFNGKPLISRAITSAKNSKYAGKIIVASDNQEHLDVAQRMGVEGVLRPKELSFDYIGLVRVYQYILEILAKRSESADLLVLIEEIYPFRLSETIDQMIENILHADYDSVIAASAEYSSMWRKVGENLVHLDSGMMPTKFKDPVYKALIGLGYVTHPNVIMEGEKIGPRTGLIKVEDPFSQIVIHNDTDLMMAEALEEKWQIFVGQYQSQSTV